MHGHQFPAAPRGHRWTLAEQDTAKRRGDVIHSVRLGASTFSWHIAGMATYTIIQHPGGTSYDITVIGDDGARPTMLGFQTEADAQDWIARD
jgi:hypothetical protein